MSLWGQLRHTSAPGIVARRNVSAREKVKGKCTLCVSTPLTCGNPLEIWHLPGDADQGFLFTLEGTPSSRVFVVYGNRS